MSVNEKMTSIADAIREKTGTEKKLSLDGILQAIPEVHEQGKQAQYDEFWNNYLLNNRPEICDYRFAGKGWTDETFKPTQDLKPTNANGMFYASLITNLKDDLAAIDRTLDFGNCTVMYSVFEYSLITHIGVVDSRKSAILNNTFARAAKLKSVDKLILTSDGTQTFPNTFLNDTSLENILFEGVIGNSVNFGSSPLSKDTIISAINALSASTTGKTLTLNKTAVNNAFGINIDDGTTYPIGSEFYNLRHSKDNWTFNFV